MPAKLSDTSIVQEPQTRCQFEGCQGSCTKHVVGVVHRMDNATRKWCYALPLCDAHLRH